MGSLYNLFLPIFSFYDLVILYSILFSKYLRLYLIIFSRKFIFIQIFLYIIINHVPLGKSLFHPLSFKKILKTHSSIYLLIKDLKIKPWLLMKSIISIFYYESKFDKENKFSLFLLLSNFSEEESSIKLKLLGFFVYFLS